MGNIIWVRHLNLSKNKTIEFQLSRWKQSPLFNLEFWRRDKTHDHWGWSVFVTLFRIEFMVDFYDRRHVE